MNIVIWNPFKLSMHADGLSQNKGESDYDYLLRFEDVNGGMSSQFAVNSVAHAKTILEAIENETDVTMGYAYIDDEGNLIEPESDKVAA
jgi:hypothetical protein